MSSDAGAAAPTAPPPAPDASRVGTRRSAAVEAAMTSAYRVLSSGTIFTGLVLAYAAGPLVIGLAGAIPFLARSGQLVAPPLVRRAGASRVMRLAGWLERLCYVATALVGLARPPHAIFWLLTGLALGSVCGTIYDVALTTVTADVVDAGERGSFFATRTRWASALGVLAGISAGLLINVAERHGVLPTTVRGVAILGGLVPALVATAALRRFDRAPRLPQPARRAPCNTAERQLVAIEERETRRALRAALVFAGAYGLATGLITRHIDVFAAHVLHYSIGTLTVVSGVVAGAGFFGAATWGAAADRFGAKPIVTISTVLTALNPLWYALATARHPWPYMVGQVLGGVAGAGWTIGVPLLMLRPTFGGADRVRALALFQATVGISSGVAPIVGGALLELTGGVGAHAAYALLFATSLAGRVAAVWLLRRVPDAGGERTRYVATVVLRVQSRRLVARLVRRARAA